MAERSFSVAEIEKIIGDVARAQFPRSLEAVRVIEDTDADGEPIYRVTVVLDTAKELDSQKASGFVRHIRPKLMEREQFRFPLVRFMSKADARKLAAA